MLPNQQVPEHSNLIDSRADFNEDGWNLEESLHHCKYQKYMSFVSLLFSIPLIVLPFIFYESYSVDTVLILGILGVISLIISLLAFIWSNFYLRPSNTPQDRAEISKLGSVLFVFVTALLIIYGLMLMVSYSSLSIYKNEMVAQGDGSNIASFNIEVIRYGCYLVGFFIIQALLLGYVAFVLYICSVNETFNRILLNIYLIFFLFFNLSLIYLSTQISDLMSSRTIQQYSNTSYSISAMILGIIGSVISFISIFINVRRWRIAYLVLGSTLLIFIVIGLILSGLTYRQAEYIQESYEDNCVNDMKSINAIDLIEQGCPSKYQTTTALGVHVFDLNCPANAIALVWENDQNLNVTDKVNALACLNQNCCGLLGNIFSTWYYGLAYTYITMSIFAFCCVCCLYYLSIKVSLGKNYIIKLDYLFWIVMVLMVLALTLMTQFYQAENMSEEEYIVTSNPHALYDLQFQSNNQAKVYSSNGLVCQSFYDSMTNLTEYVQMIDYNASNTFNSKNEIIRLALLGNGNFSFDVGSSYSSDDLIFYSKSYQSEFFPNNDSNSDFILFEGYNQIIDKFLKGNLQFCLNDYAAKPQFSYVKYVVSQGSNILNISKSIKTEKTIFFKENVKNNKNHKDTTYYSTSELIYNAEAILDQYLFGNLKVSVYDSETSDTLSDVEVILYNSINGNCYTEHSEPLITGTTDNKGVISFLNIFVKEYSLYLQAEGYKSNCMKISNISIFDNPNLEVVMVPEFNDVAMKVLLFWNKPLITLSLQSSFNYNSEEMCISSFYQTSCGEMTSSNMQTVGDLNYQVININEIGNYTYLFYVQKIPNQDGLIYYELEQKLGNILNFTNITINNQDLVNSQPAIQIFVQGMSYPVDTLSPPSLKAADISEPDLIWLGFCVDGRIGEVSERKIQQYWTKTNGNLTFYQRQLGNKNMFPDAITVCKGVY